MKANSFLAVILLFSISCEKDQYSKPVSIEYESSFSTESWPYSIAINENHGYVYVANDYPAINNYSSKIQKFDINGKFLNTVIDFTTFNQGKYSFYESIDFCIDNNGNIYILVQPRQLNGETGIHVGGFCILKFDSDDKFQKEYDFSKIDFLWYPSRIAYSKNYLYVKNGLTIKKISTDNDQVPVTTIQIKGENLDSIKCFQTSDIAIESDGTFYFTGQDMINFDSKYFDFSGCHITKFNPQNSKILSFSSKSRTGSDFAMQNSPGLAFSDAGNLYLVTFYGMSLEVYDRNDNFILQTDIRIAAGEETRPIGVALNGDKIYIIDYLNSKVFVYKESY
jgi:DNA-binding beta-propeller fold protein YncE